MQMKPNKTLFKGRTHPFRGPGPDGSEWIGCEHLALSRAAIHEGRYHEIMAVMVVQEMREVGKSALKLCTEHLPTEWSDDLIVGQPLHFAIAHDNAISERHFVPEMVTYDKMRDRVIFTLQDAYAKPVIDSGAKYCFAVSKTYSEGSAIGVYERGGPLRGVVMPMRPNAMPSCVRIDRHQWPL